MFAVYHSQSMRRMPCECCQIKKSRRNGFLEPRRKCCKVCHRILCHFCATQKICRFCVLKETTIMEKDKLMKLTEEELIEIAEAFEVSIDSKKLLKCELVQLILITCKSPNSLKSPPGTPKMPSRNVSPTILDDDIPMTHKKISPARFELFENLKVNSFEIQKKHEEMQYKFVGKRLSLLPDTNEKTKPTENNFSTEKHEIIQDIVVGKSVILPQEGNQKVLKSSMQDARVVVEKKDAVRFFANSKVDEVDPQPSIRNNSEKQPYKANRKATIQDIKSREGTKKLSSKETKQILRDEQVDLMRHNEKNELTELALGFWDSIHTCDQISHNESKETESDCSFPRHSHSNKESQVILAEQNSQQQAILSLSDITSSDVINELSIGQLKRILKDHSIDSSGFIEKWELAYKVLHLWHDMKNKEGNEPEVLFENVQLRFSPSGSPVRELKANYIKAKKRRGLYVTRNADIEEAVHQQSLWEGMPHCESIEEEDCILSKKKKMEDEKKLQKQPKTNLKIDVQAALLPPMRHLSIDDVISPDNIKGLSSPELLGILRNHPSNSSGLDQDDENNRWKLAFKVLELWNAEHSLKVQEQLEECKICMESTANCTLLDCGHVATCFQCGKNLRLCPICRQDVVRVVQLYKA